jgi:fatty acid amide hydrolase
MGKTGVSQGLIEHVLRADVVELVRMLNKREVSSEQLVAIYGQRAATVGRELCIITEDNFKFALEKARECDRERSQSGRRNFTIGEEWNASTHLPVLFGVPISIKDNIEMESTVATVGLSARANNISTADSPQIVCIKRNGMIPFMKTNLPQLAFNFDSNNPLWGRVLNPWNHNKSAGGSSGGEAAAISAGISPIGVGNDMGGSLRLPAHFCGISSLMPSAHRLPELGIFT